MAKVDITLHMKKEGTLPRVPFDNIKRAILGTRYELSLVLMDDELATKLNKEHKGKEGPTNILTFPIDTNEGEVFINLDRAERDAESFGHTLLEHIAFLYIHGCLHLKGTVHGDAMEQEEERLLETLFVHAQK